MNATVESETRRITGWIAEMKDRGVIFYPGEVTVARGRILKVRRQLTTEVDNVWITPGFFNCHFHPESSKLVPAEVGRWMARAGTTAGLADVHEAANVGGLPAILWMWENALLSPAQLFQAFPSCVPATELDTTGGRITFEDFAAAVNQCQRFRLAALGEVMDIGGVLGGPSQGKLRQMVQLAQANGLIIQGHLPSAITGEALKSYFAFGIEDNHESDTLEHALACLSAGMKFVVIREGSAAQNWNRLRDLLWLHPGQVGFGTDDLAVDTLVNEGDILPIVRMGLRAGVPLDRLIQAACFNPVSFYKVDCGLLRPGDRADLNIIDRSDPLSVRILETIVDGETVASDGYLLVGRTAGDAPNNFNAQSISEADLLIRPGGSKMRVIGIDPLGLQTHEIQVDTPVRNGHVVSVPGAEDILMFAIRERYGHGLPLQVMFVHGFGLSRGAIAFSVLHDCHNVGAIGTNSADIVRAMNLVIERKGGIAVVDGPIERFVPLDVYGLMSSRSGEEMAGRFAAAERMVRDRFGSPLPSAFLKATFLALSVIPELKGNDQLGLVRNNAGTIRPETLFLA